MVHVNDFQKIGTAYYLDTFADSWKIARSPISRRWEIYKNGKNRIYATTLTSAKRAVISLIAYDAKVTA
jgi:hypothetical protein